MLAKVATFVVILIRKLYCIAWQKYYCSKCLKSVLDENQTGSWPSKFGIFLANRTPQICNETVSTTNQINQLE